MLDIRVFGITAAAVAFTVVTMRNPRYNNPFKRYLVSKLVLLAHLVGNGSSPPSHIEPQFLPQLTKLFNENIVRIVGANPGKFTLQGTNIYLVGSGRTRILIDTGAADASFFRNLKNLVREERFSVENVFITHGHIDHEGGNENIRSLFPNVKFWKMRSKKGYEKETDLFGNIYENLEENQEFKVDPGLVLQPHHTPGHTSDHCSFSLVDTNRKEMVIFSGDCVLGSSTPVFTNLYEYMHSLEVLKKICISYENQGLKVIICPGHGPLIENAVGKLEEYIKHRVQRENQILNLIETRHEPVTIQQMMEDIYDSKKLSLIVQHAAKSTIKHHLKKLEQEKRIGKNGQGYFLV